jgi:hypothetical protein
VSWLAKSTIVYYSPPNISNPVWTLLIPEFRAGRYNPNNLLTMFFDIGPKTAIYMWPILFICSVVILTLWYRAIIRKQN